MMRWGWLLLGCLLLPAPADAEEKLGRLFFTPAERANLDALRQNSQSPAAIEESGNDEDGNEAKPPALPIISVGGYVKRSDGKTTVWVNGHPLREKATTKDIVLGKLRKDSNRVPLKLQSTGRTIALKPGQIYDPASGRVVDSLKDLPVPAAR